MRNKLIAILVILVMVISSVPVSAFAETATDYIPYNCSGTTIYYSANTGEIRKCDNDKIRSIVIPSEINGTTITGIGERAFENFYELETVVLPETITKLSYGAFSGCTKLSNCNIPDSINYIGPYAFFITRLNSIVLPEGIKFIGSSAFAGNPITSIVLPESITSIDSSVFWGCAKLRSVTILGDVRAIGSDAFSGCSSLVSIDLPSSLERVEQYAFKDCTALKTVNVSPGVEWRVGVFDGCMSLISDPAAEEADRILKEGMQLRVASVKSSYALLEYTEPSNGVDYLFRSVRYFVNDQGPYMGYRGIELKNLQPNTEYTVKATMLIVCGKDYDLEESVSFTTLPEETSIKSLIKMNKSFKVRWGAVSNIDGYQIRYSTKSNMALSKTKTINKGSISTTVKSLKAKKKYYVQVRTYANVDGKRQYSSWSSKKTVITK